MLAETDGAVGSKGRSLRTPFLTHASDCEMKAAEHSELEQLRFAPPPRWQLIYAKWLIVTDLLAVLLAICFAQLVRFGSDSPLGASLPLVRSITYLEISGAIAILWLGALTINRSRSHRIIGSGVEEYRRVWLATISTFVAIAIVSMLFKLEVARGYLVLALPAGLVLLFSTRWLARLAVSKARRDSGKCINRLLVVGSPQAVRDLAHALWREPGSGYEVVGACVPGKHARTAIGIPGLGSISVIGDESMVLSAIAATGCNAVAVATGDEFHGKRLQDLSWQLEGLEIDLMVAPGVIDVAGPRLHMRPVAGLPLIHVEKPQYNGAKQFQKRLFDVVFAGLALACSLPLLLTIAVVIKLTSKGPVFFRHQRIGLDGKPFEMFKFRTMVQGADVMFKTPAASGSTTSPRDPFKCVDDPRITTVGRFLRRYSLDELPQFINVLKRDMSVVGPRPQVTREVELYDDEAMRRLLVRPGITGLWQVSGRSELSWEDSVRLDLYYVENWSMIADLLIAIKTLRVVLNHTGAY